MSQRILVSIVSHNSAQHLRSCLESLKAQTYRDFSVALWDNASQDDTHSIIHAYRDFLSSTQLSDKKSFFIIGDLL